MQQVVTLSTAEAEYVSLSMCIQEVIWLVNLLCEMGVKYEKPVIIHEDNQSAIAIANNNGYQSRAKHIDIRHHFIREHIKTRKIELQYIESKCQLADFLTKSLATKPFKFMVYDSHIRNCKSRV
jgi:hypothetical protein